MSGRGPKSKAGGRQIAHEEAELWAQATRALDKIKVKPRVGAVSEAPTKQVAPKARSRAAERGTPPQQEASETHAQKLVGAPLADFERRNARQIASGKVQIDARLDLHGLTQRQAHASLRRFLHDAYALGFRTVLIITGKGRDEGQGDHLARAYGELERGVLRRAVPRWLEDQDFRPVVMSFTTAHTRHGGEGALYVKLRKPPSV